MIAIDPPQLQTRRPLHVRSHVNTAQYVYVTMLLALHGVTAKVRQESESAAALLRTHLRSHSGHFGYHGVQPQLSLAVMLLWNRQQHYGHPPEPVTEHHHIIVFVQYLGRLPPCRDFAEDAEGAGQSALLINELNAPVDTSWSRVSAAPRCPDSPAQ